MVYSFSRPFFIITKRGILIMYLIYSVNGGCSTNKQSDNGRMSSLLGPCVGTGPTRAATLAEKKPLFSARCVTPKSTRSYSAYLRRVRFSRSVNCFKHRGSINLCLRHDHMTNLPHFAHEVPFSVPSSAELKVIHPACACFPVIRHRSLARAARISGVRKNGALGS